MKLIKEYSKESSEATYELFINDYPELENINAYYGDFYKNIVEYNIVKDNKRLYFV